MVSSESRALASRPRLSKLTAPSFMSARLNQPAARPDATMDGNAGSARSLSPPRSKAK
jgi:hypothetical protein